jgi:DNA mismatch endonuclease, patch repair protein
MRRTRRSGTRPELALSRAAPTWLEGSWLTGLCRRAGTVLARRHPVARRAIAVFVDGCFWHSCPEHRPLPKTNTSWWRLKFRGIARRDRDTDT